MQLAERTAMMGLEVNSMNEATHVNNKDALNRNERKWGRPLMKAGWGSVRRRRGRRRPIRIEKGPPSEW